MPGYPEGICGVVYKDVDNDLMQLQDEPLAVLQVSCQGPLPDEGFQCQLGQCLA